MYGVLLQQLRKRATPINIAVIGCGFFGSGLVREIFRIPNMNATAIVIRRDKNKAVETYLSMGVKRASIHVACHTNDLAHVAREACHFVLSDIQLISELKDIDVIFDASGSLLAGAQAAMIAIELGIDFVTVNAEVEATLGVVLTDRANRRGIQYSVCNGDQPGVLSEMLQELTFQGFEPKIVGSCKEHFDLYQTPLGVMPFVPPDQNPAKICSFTDGSKQSLELTVVANAFGFYPLTRGMYGPHTSKADIIRSFSALIDLRGLKGGYIDFTCGSTEPEQGGPVFVIAYHKNPDVREALRILKKGSGPYYLFFRDYHLCHIEACSSIAEVVLFGHPTLRTQGRYVETIAVAKRDLWQGTHLDGIGGFDCYGLVERADVAESNDFLPLGLAEFAVAVCDIPKDQAIRYEWVELEDNLVVQLRREQDALPLPVAPMQTHAQP
jgi:predicted homoserine dehydrogenase-like protein